MSTRQEHEEVTTTTITNHSMDSPATSGADAETPTNSHVYCGIYDRTHPTTVAVWLKKNQPRGMFTYQDPIDINPREDPVKYISQTFNIDRLHDNHHHQMTKCEPVKEKLLEMESNPEAGPLSIRSQAIRCIGVLLVCLFLMCLSLNFVNSRMPNPKDVPPLPDIMFELLPQLPIEHLTDVCIWGINFACFAVLGSLFVKHRYINSLSLPGFLARAAEVAAVAQAAAVAAEREKQQQQQKSVLGSLGIISEKKSSEGTTTPEKKKVPVAPATSRFAFLFHGLVPIQDVSPDDIIYPEVLRQYKVFHKLYYRLFIRYSLTYGLVCVLRSVVNLMTSMPATLNKCQHPTPISNIWWNSVIGLVTFGGGNIHCGDLMFSGHTVCIAVGAMATCIYGPLISGKFRLNAIFWSVLSVFTILSSRSHYSDDVIIAWYITCTAFALMPEHVPIWLVPLVSPTAWFRRMSYYE